MRWLARGGLFALGWLACLWLSSPDFLHALGGWAARLGDEIQKWEGQRDERLAKMIAREMRTEP